MKDSSTMIQDVSSRATVAIELRNVTKRFMTPAAQTYTALRDLSMSVAPGEFPAQWLARPVAANLRRWA